MIILINSKSQTRYYVNQFKSKTNLIPVRTHLIFDSLPDIDIISMPPNVLVHIRKRIKAGLYQNIESKDLKDIIIDDYAEHFL